MMKSSKDNENASRAAPTTPGSTSGKVTRQNVAPGPAKRSWAASSSRGSRLCSRALTVTTTKLMQNMTCAMTIVQNPSFRPKREKPWTKMVSRLAPRTISGVAMGMKTSTLLAALPRKRWRTRAKASMVPSTVATTVAITPTWSEVTSASQTPGAPQGSFQCLSVGPAAEFQTMLDLR